MTLHEITSAKEGDSFISVGPVVVSGQTAPKLSKNGKLYSTAFLKNGGSDMSLLLWDGAAGWKLPQDKEIVLKGKFTKSSFGNRPSIKCEELNKPEGAEEFKAEEIQAPAERPSVKASIDVGLRAIEYVSKKGFPQLSEAAFAFAARAFLDGHKLE